MAPAHCYTGRIGASGDIFGGTARYAIEGEIGSGAMGVVYRAHDRERDQVVALKVLRRFDPLAIYRFKHEFRALADVAHPNLVSLYELESVGEQWFFTMELIDGVDFLAHVRDGDQATAERGADTTGTMDTVTLADATPASLTGARRHDAAPLGDAAQLARLRAALRQLAIGVQALHDRGTLHRDIKPSNVLVDRGRRVVLLDFGVVTELAARSGVDVEGARLVGTPAYMAPEQGTDQPLTEASDWYSVGVMLYEALVGRRPYTGSLRDVLELKRSCDPAAPRELAPEVPADLEQLCLELLQRAPGDRPDGRAILRTLGVDSAARAATARPASRLVGRERHLAALRAAFADAQAGAPVTALVSGPSGMGKSALVQQLFAELRATGRAIVLDGRCYERESVPHKALDDLMDELARVLLTMPRREVWELMPRDILALARLFPVLRRVEAVLGGAQEALALADPHAQRRAAVAALRELLVRLSARSPVVMHIDDVQWGDSDSADVLAEALRPPFAPPVLLIASYRSDGDSGPFVARLAETGHRMIEIPVDRLELREARALASAVLAEAGLGDRHADAIAHEAAGSPFFVTELARYAAEHAPSDGEHLEIALDELLHARVRELPDAARALLEVVAVAGRPVLQGVAARAADVAGGERGAVAALRGANLVRTRGVRERDHIETYHDRIREAVVARMSEGALRDCHARLAYSLEATGEADPETLAAHFERAGELARAGEHYARAADVAAEQLAFLRAGALYWRAVELLAPEPAARSELYARAAEAYSNGGKGLEAAEAYEAAARGANKAMALRYRGLACEQLLRSGRIAEGEAAMARVLREVGLTLPRGKRRALVSLGLLRARIRLRGLGFRPRDASQVTLEQLTRIDVCWSAAAAFGMSDHVLAAAFQARHLLEALRAGEPSHITRALAMESVFRSFDGARARAAVERIDARTAELAERVQDVSSLAWLYGARAFTRYQVGDWAVAAELADRALEYVRRGKGMWWEQSSVELYRLWALYWLGAGEELAERVPQLLRDAEARGDLYSYTNLCIGPPALAWLVRDEPAQGRAAANDAVAMWARESYHLQHYWHAIAQTNALLYVGDAVAAHQRMASEWRELQRNMLLRIQIVRIESHYLRGVAAASAAARDPANARELLRDAARCERALRKERRVYATAMAAAVGGSIAVARGDHDGAAAVLREAQSAAEDASMGLIAAAIQRRCGELLGGDAGDVMVREANAAMRDRGVEAPEKMARVFAPAVLPP